MKNRRMSLGMPAVLYWKQPAGIVDAPYVVFVTYWLKLVMLQLPVSLPSLERQAELYYCMKPEVLKTPGQRSFGKLLYPS